MQKFAEKYPPDCTVRTSRKVYADEFAGYTSASHQLATYSGCTFGAGIYRLYSVDEVRTWTTAVQECFPKYTDRVRCFGRDWLCNQFCLDSERRETGEALILLFEIGTGQVLKIPETFESFHSALIVNDPEAALAELFFGRWRSVDPRPLADDECVGYKVPLFLGGKDEVGNLARSDASVYWHLAAQMLVRASALRHGTEIKGVSVKD